MNAKRRLLIALLLVISVIVGPLWAGTVTAAPAQAELLQPPPPEPPSEPPPGAGDSGSPPYTPPEPSADDEGASEPDPYVPPSDDDATPEEAESPPPMPYGAPSLPALPDPSSVEEGNGPYAVNPSGEGWGEGAAMIQAVPFMDFSVYVDRGCGTVYEAGDSIEFSVAADWEVFDPATDYWRYLEVWGSTNGAWWHQVIRGRWIEPRDSVSRAGFVGRPVGNELIYARLLDRSGIILDESTCAFTSQEVAVVPDPDPSIDGWIGCGETQSAYVEAGAEHLWSFAGRRGRQVTIMMTGDYGFDTYLELLDPNGRLLHENDDISSNNVNSRLRAILPRTGAYTIAAHGYDYGEGGYTLSLACR
ncbi:MAG: hypothetical protein IT329_01680 [Caldilineaceae bacterium]|nr:hypothetical protein [Caldilineaceae bacterium]